LSSLNDLTGVRWVLVARFTLLERSAPAALQGRVHSAAGAWLLTRAAQGVSASD
jgi:hypothetical protein